MNYRIRTSSYFDVAAEMNGEIVLLLIYDKENASTAKINVLKQIIKEEGYLLQ